MRRGGEGGIIRRAHGFTMGMGGGFEDPRSARTRREVSDYCKLLSYLIQL